MNRLPHPDLERFAAAVASRLGCELHPHNADLMDEALRGALRRTGTPDLDSYLSRLDDPQAAQRELREVALDLTVGETYFFRQPEQFQAFADVAVPERIRARRSVRQLNVLSAGCASGEEAYSLAAVLGAAPGLQGWDLRLVGIDVNPAFLEKARRARYSKWSLRALSDARRDLHFRLEGADYLVHDALRTAVRFEEHNLLDDDPQFWRPGHFDIVFCRNVLIYFAPAAYRAVVARLADSLAPGGFLFLGPSETLRGISTRFHLRQSHGAFYYQLRGPDEPASLPPAGPRAVRTDATAVPSAGVAGGDGWVAAVDGATRRIAEVTERSLRASRPAGTPQRTTDADPGRSSPSPAIGEVHGLVREERFDEALTLLSVLPHAAEGEPETLLLRAVVLLHTGDVAGAETLCGHLLARDELAPGARYLMALCHERRGDLLAAAECDRAAIHLDGAFAMPRLHLGLLALRLGDRATARRELTEALRLLAGEDASRLLLFGGGFGREALVRLCQGQLGSLQGGPMSRGSEDRARRLAAMRQAFDEAFGLPVAGARPPTVRYLRIRVGDQRFALRVGDLQGLDVQRTVVPVPGTDPRVLGVCALRGRLVAVHDLAAILGLQGRSDGRRRFLALLGGDDPIAVAFEGLDGMSDVPAGELEAIDGAKEGALSREVVRIEAERIPVVELASVARLVRPDAVER